MKIVTAGVLSTIVGAALALALVIPFTNSTSGSDFPKASLETPTMPSPARLSTAAANRGPNLHHRLRRCHTSDGTLRHLHLLHRLRRNRTLPYLLSYLGFLLLTLLQNPGHTVADTKHDLTANPLGFLARATSLWDSTAPMGQLQNQAYGYLFPQGPFFAVGHLLHLPGWLIQRLWWALLLWVGFWGILWLARTLRIGGPRSRTAGALVYVLSPRIFTTLGAISFRIPPLHAGPLGAGAGGVGT